MDAKVQTVRQVEPVQVKRWETFVPLVVIGISLLSWWPRLEGPIDLRWDAGAYYVLGTALAEGKGYRLLNEPGEIQAVQYPPVLAAIVAAHQLVLRTNDPMIVGNWLRISFFAIYTGFLLAAYYVLRRQLPLSWAFLGTAVCGINLFTIFLSDLCFAEIPFGLASLLFVVFAANGQGRYHAAFAVIFATIAYFLRTAGLALFVAWVADSLFRREFKTAAVRMVISLLPIIGWQMYIASVERGDSYTHPAYEYQREDYLFYNTSYARNVSLRDPFSPEKGKATSVELVERFIGNLGLMPVSLGEALTARKEAWHKWFSELSGMNPPEAVMYVGTGFLGLIVLGGTLLQLRTGQILVPIYVLTYMAAVCLTPWPFQWTRYWVPLAPLLVLSLIVSLVAVRDWVKALPRWWRLMAEGMVAGIVVVVLTLESLTSFNMFSEHHQTVESAADSDRQISYRLFFYDSGYRELDRALTWMKAHANKGDVVAGSMPHWVYLHTGLKTVMPPFERDAEKAQALLDSVPVRFVIVDKTVVDFARQYMMPLFKGAPDRWALVYATEGEDNLRVYERIPSSGNHRVERSNG